jgi:formamidopyrimidine-DNA glycosylase
MPELPDVEGFRRFLERHAQGQRIVRLDVPDKLMARNRSPGALGCAVRGRSFGAPTRHGKWLIAPLDGDGSELLLHFGMTGLLRWGADPDDRHRHDRVVFVCDGGELRYNNMRRFGGVWLASDPDERRAVTGALGPDAADLHEEEFMCLLERRRGGVKAALMDQRLISGIGNLLSDEILWRARIHPATAVSRLAPPGESGCTRRCGRPSASRFVTDGSRTARGGSHECVMTAAHRARDAGRACAGRRSPGVPRAGVPAASADSDAAANTTNGSQ